MFDYSPRAYAHLAGDMNGSIELHERALEGLLSGFDLERRHAEGSVAIDVCVRGAFRAGHRYASLIFLEDGPRGTTFLATTFPDALEPRVLLDYFAEHAATYHTRSDVPNDS